MSATIRTLTPRPDAASTPRRPLPETWMNHTDRSRLMEWGRRPDGSPLTDDDFERGEHPVDRLPDAERVRIRKWAGDNPMPRTVTLFRLRAHLRTPSLF